MAEASIPVDLFNPGQVFACLGFMEAAEILLGDVEGGFDWSDEANVKFILRAAQEKNPFEAVLEFLAEAEVMSLAPQGSDLSTEKWDVETRTLPENEGFPFAEPTSPATLPAALRRGRHQIVIDHWGDSTGLRDKVKFWAGAGGYPGAALLRDALNLVREKMKDAAVDPFALTARQSSSFRLDWRRDYIPIDAGFSPNEHGNISMLGYPLVEIMAAIGLTHARPHRVHKLRYRYGVAGGIDLLLMPMLLRAALGGALAPFPTRLFHMELGWPGQENQARCITDVTEER
jgi:CRISPR-associated protein Csx14